MRLKSDPKPTLFERLLPSIKAMKGTKCEAFPGTVDSSTHQINTTFESAEVLGCRRTERMKAAMVKPLCLYETAPWVHSLACWRDFFSRLESSRGARMHAAAVEFPWSHDSEILLCALVQKGATSSLFLWPKETEHFFVRFASATYAPLLHSIGRTNLMGA